MLARIRPSILLSRCRIAAKSGFVGVRGIKNHHQALLLRNCSTQKTQSEPAAEKTGYEIDRISADDYDDFDPNTANPQEKITAITGDSPKAYGRDVGRNEGRRNHVDSYKYSAPDGSQRSRVRFFVKGPKGKVIVWAELSSKMADNQYVYLICQDARTGHVVTIEDNRSMLESQMLGDGMQSAEGQNALSKLLGSFSK